MCDLDPVNYCCWTHGVDIDQGDYLDGYCHIGRGEAEAEADQTDQLDDDDLF